MSQFGLRQKPDREKWYAIPGERLERIQEAVLRLYSEKGFAADEMRDMAQRLEWAVYDAVEVPDERGKP